MENAAVSVDTAKLEKLVEHVKQASVAHAQLLATKVRMEQSAQQSHAALWQFDTQYREMQGQCEDRNLAVYQCVSFPFPCYQPLQFLPILRQMVVEFLFFFLNYFFYIFCCYWQVFGTSGNTEQTAVRRAVRQVCS